MTRQFSHLYIDEKSIIECSFEKASGPQKKDLARPLTIPIAIEAILLQSPEGLPIEVLSTCLEEVLSLLGPLAGCLQPRIEVAPRKVLLAEKGQLREPFTLSSDLAVAIEPDNEVLAFESLGSRRKHILLQGLFMFEQVNLVEPALYYLSHPVRVHVLLDCKGSFALIIVFMRVTVPCTQYALQQLAIKVLLAQHANLPRLLHLYCATEQVAEGLLQERLSLELSDHLVFKEEATPIAERGSYLSLVSTLLTELKDVLLPLPLEEIASERAQYPASAELVSLTLRVSLGANVTLEAPEGGALQ